MWKWGEWKLRPPFLDPPAKWVDARMLFRIFRWRGKLLVGKKKEPIRDVCLRDHPTRIVMSSCRRECWRRLEGYYQGVHWTTSAAYRMVDFSTSYWRMLRTHSYGSASSFGRPGRYLGWPRNPLLPVIKWAEYRIRKENKAHNYQFYALKACADSNLKREDGLPGRFRSNFGSIAQLTQSMTSERMKRCLTCLSKKSIGNQIFRVFRQVLIYRAW